MHLSPRPARAIASAAVLLLALAGCGSNGPTGTAPVTPTPAAPTATSTADAPTPVPTDPGATPASSPPSQTETDWGRIWDGLPRAFPSYPGASPTETGAGPASAILDVGDIEPAEVASFYVSALEFAGYHTLARSDPREDGSIEVEWAGETTCRILATITPMGGTTIVSILYGADCPFE